MYFIFALADDCTFLDSGNSIHLPVVFSIPITFTQLILY